MGSGNDRSRSSVDTCSDFFCFAAGGGGTCDACGNDDLREGTKVGFASGDGVRGEDESMEDDSGEDGSSSGTPRWCTLWCCGWGAEMEGGSADAVRDAGVVVMAMAMADRWL